MVPEPTMDPSALFRPAPHFNNMIISSIPRAAIALMGHIDPASLARSEKASKARQELKRLHAEEILPKEQLFSEEKKKWEESNRPKYPDTNQYFNARCKWELRFKKKHLIPIYDKIALTAKHYSEFWLDALLCYKIIKEKITEKDCKALVYLEKVESERTSNFKGFKLKFTFGKNRYFENSVLTKTYEVTGDNNDSVSLEAIGDKIEWKPSHNLTVNKRGKRLESFFHFFDSYVLTKTTYEVTGNNNDSVSLESIGDKIEWKPSHKLTGNKGGKRMESFFHFFYSYVNSTPLSFDTETDKLKGKYPEDYEIGITLRDKIIPQTIPCFTGQARVDEEEKDADSDDYEERDDDSDDSEESDNDSDDSEESDDDSDDSEDQSQDQGEGADMQLDMPLDTKNPRKRGRDCDDNAGNSPPRQVEFATPEAARKDNNSYQKEAQGRSQSVFVRGFDASQGEDKIRSSLQGLFASCGEITRLSIPTDRVSGKIKGIAYLDFKNAGSFNKALELNGSDLGGSCLTVEEARPRGGIGGSRGGRFGGGCGGRDGAFGGHGGRFGGRGGRRGGCGGRDGGRFFMPNLAAQWTGKKTTFIDED